MYEINNGILWHSVLGVVCAFFLFTKSIKRKSENHNNRKLNRNSSARFSFFFLSVGCVFVVVVSMHVIR